MTEAPRMTWGVVVHHPSGRPEVAATLARLTERLAASRPGYVLWSLGSPLDEVLAHAASIPPQGEIIVVPLLLAPGKHYVEDVPRLARALSAARPDLRVIVRPPLLEDDSFLVAWLEGL